MPLACQFLHAFLKCTALQPVVVNLSARLMLHTTACMTMCRFNMRTWLCVLQLHRLVINVGKLAEGYKKAGQFVQIKVGDSKPGFFAIASAPNSSSDGLIEVLIKDGSPGTAASLLCEGPQGMRPRFYHMSAVCGFPFMRCMCKCCNAVSARQRGQKVRLRQAQCVHTSWQSSVHWIASVHCMVSCILLMIEKTR